MKRPLINLLPLALAGFALAPTIANAEPTTPTDGLVQDDTDDESTGDDDLDDILNQGSGEETVKEEQEDVKAGKLDDRAGETKQYVLAGEAREKRIIKTIEKKNFLKLGRFEVTPNVAFVTNDPFLNRYILGTGLAYHATEIFALELNLGFSPNLGEADWKALTKQLVNQNHVSPDLSPMQVFGNTTFSFSPIYGKVAISGQKVINFDIFGAFGMGVAQTSDDLKALQAEGDQQALATQNQVHPTTNFGGGARVVMGESFAFRVEGRSLVYIETVNSTTLEMKNNFILQAGLSFFFPGMD